MVVFEDFSVQRKNPKKKMDSVQALITQIQGLSSSAGDVSRLHSNLKQAEETIFSESARLFSALDQLDPSIHSLGYLYILYALLLFLQINSSYPFFFPPFLVERDCVLP